jgi:hypothetical protein
MAANQIENKPKMAKSHREYIFTQNNNCEKVTYT